MIFAPAIGSGRVAVKICGLRSAAHALSAAQAGADLLGFNFATVSRRRVTPGVAGEAIVACRDAVSAPPAMVGVFVNQPAAEIAETARRCALDVVQLSGSESAALCADVLAATGLPVIKAVRLADAQALADAEALAAAVGLAALLVDAPVPGAWGGTGQDWDWQQAAPLAQRFPLLLAGGLHAENVGAAVEAVRPWGVDVASGVESAGETDPARVAAFVAGARAGARAT